MAAHLIAIFKQEIQTLLKYGTEVLRPLLARFLNKVADLKETIDHLVHYETPKT